MSKENTSKLWKIIQEAQEEFLAKKHVGKLVLILPLKG